MWDTLWSGIFILATLNGAEIQAVTVLLLSLGLNCYLQFDVTKRNRAVLKIAEIELLEEI